MQMSDKPARERGRPPLPKDEKRVKTSITIDNDILAWIDEQVGTHKRSQFINKVLRKAKEATSP